MHFEPTMLDAFKESPLYFALSFLCAIAGVGLALGALVSKGRARASLGFAAALLGAMAIAVGAYDASRRQAVIPRLVAMPDLTAADIARIRAHTGGLAEKPRRFGLMVGALPLLAGLALGVSGLRRARPHLASAGSSM